MGFLPAGRRGVRVATSSPWSYTRLVKGWEIAPASKCGVWWHAHALSVVMRTFRRERNELRGQLIHAELLHAIEIVDYSTDTPHNTGERIRV